MVLFWTTFKVYFSYRKFIIQIRFKIIWFVQTKEKRLCKQQLVYKICPKSVCLPLNFKCVNFPAFHARLCEWFYFLMASICHQNLRSFHALFRRSLATLFRLKAVSCEVRNSLENLRFYLSEGFDFGVIFRPIVAILVAGVTAGMADWRQRICVRSSRTRNLHGA